MMQSLRKMKQSAIRKSKKKKKLRPDKNCANTIKQLLATQVTSVNFRFFCHFSDLRVALSNFQAVGQFWGNIRISGKFEPFSDVLSEDSIRPNGIGSDRILRNF